MTNRDVAAVLETVADLLEIKGESRFRVGAYRRAAESLTALGRDVREVRREGGLEAVPNVGAAIAQKVGELLDTGRLGYLEALEAEVPRSLATLLQVPDLGPKKIKLFWEKAGVTDLASLEAAAREGRLRDLPGMGPKSEAKLLEGLASLARRTGRTPLGRALPAAEAQLALLRAVPGVERAEAVGSLRRRRETVGDLDFLAAARDAQAVMDAFTLQPSVARVLGRGDTKASVEFHDGLRAQLWVHPPERFGTALAHATGSKEHNVALRERALARGLSLSEHALTPTDGGPEVLLATEEALHRALGLSYIPPELREAGGEIRAAEAGTLPARLEAEHVLAALHNHSTWSDGRASILEMAEAAIARGYRVLAITDHSFGLGVAQGVDAEGLLRQRREIDAVQEALGDRIRLLQGVEVEIRADGTLDLEDDVLATLDVVVASLHVALRQPREQVTARALAALRNPHVDILGHPTGRLLPDREGADLDMDAVLTAARETGTALEINANPRRLDLADVYVRRAVELGVRLSINTDAHRPEHFDFLSFGIDVARRGWAPPEAVVNAWDVERMLGWLGERKG